MVYRLNQATGLKHGRRWIKVDDAESFNIATPAGQFGCYSLSKIAGLISRGVTKNQLLDVIIANVFEDTVLRIAI